MQNEKTFENFTNKYQVQKTLRFGLKPVGKTLENMRDQLEYDEELRTFLKDQRIEDAYQALKPFIDDRHERFINMALSSDAAKRIPFLDYIQRRGELMNAEGEKGDADKKLEATLDGLRSAFDKVFEKTGERWMEKYAQYEWKKGNKVAKGAGVLSSSDLLKLAYSASALLRGYRMGYRSISRRLVLRYPVSSAAG